VNGMLGHTDIEDDGGRAWCRWLRLSRLGQARPRSLLLRGQAVADAAAAPPFPSPQDLILVRVLPPGLFPQDHPCELRERRTVGHRYEPLGSDGLWTKRGPTAPGVGAAALRFSDFGRLGRARLLALRSVSYRTARFVRAARSGLGEASPAAIAGAPAPRGCGPVVTLAARLIVPNLGSMCRR
jgi:hypothetical protein